MLERAEECVAVGGPVQVAVEVHAHPLVRVGAVAVGEVQTGVHPAELGRERGDAGHGGVHVEPHVVAAAHLADRRRRIERHRRGGAVRGADEERHEPGGEVGGDRLREGIGSHGVGLVVRHDADPIGADASDPQTLLDARVGLGRRVRDQSARVAVVVDGSTGGAPAGREDRHEGGFARGALDHAAAGVTRRAERGGQVEQLLHPVEHQRLDLGARRRRHPAHPLDAESGRQQLAEDGRERVVRREVREEARVLPLGEAGHDDTFDVGHHLLERLGRGRRVFGELRSHVSGGDGRADRTLLDRADVVGDPVDQVVAVGAELIGCHTEERTGRVPWAPSPKCVQIVPLGTPTCTSFGSEPRQLGAGRVAGRVSRGPSWRRSSGCGARPRPRGRRRSPGR